MFIAKRMVWAFLAVILLVVAIAACGGTTSPTATTAKPTATQVPAPKPTTPPVPTPVPPVAVTCPNQGDWASSPHADQKAEAFVHWNSATPPEVPAGCATCHTTSGYQAFLGSDMSTPGTIAQAQKTGQVITCDACHNDKSKELDSVMFPSGIKVTDLGPEARCMVCHQGRASTVTVDKSIEKAGLKELDTPSKDLGFTNIHYFATAATLYGGVVKGGYQYPGHTYESKFEHVDGFDTCVQCHDTHSLEARIEQCAKCHPIVKSANDFVNIRTQGSFVDFDGDGNVSEGIAAEVQGLQTALYSTMQAYAKDVAKTALVYDPATYPYFFVDTNGNGKGDTDELKAENGYKAFTARLVKAAYNYHLSIKEPCAYVHNSHYVIELLYDSIDDLNAGLPTKVDISKLSRLAAGHFAGAEEPWRHWDADGEVPAGCVRCHTAGGLATFIKNNSTVAVEPSNRMKCTTCHDSLAAFTTYAVAKVTFPSGASLTFGENNPANLCVQCHQGRESTVSMNNLMKGLPEDTVSDKLRFLNIHYFAAGATLFGNDAKGAYQYDGKTYLGRNAHVQGYDVCIQCHDKHVLNVKVVDCAKCHPQVKTQEDLPRIRISSKDWDGDNKAEEGLGDEVLGFRDAVYQAMQAYGKKVAGVGIVYEPATYPYFFKDTNGNGKSDPDELDSRNAWNQWTPRLLKAAYNYQYVTKDPGAFAHNGKYIVQVLYDTLADLATQVTLDMSKMTRP